MAVHVSNRGSGRTRRSAGPAGDPILTSKITVPEVPEWAVQRPRITGMIAEGTRWCPLTVVTGPPGAGKTMALALWAAAQPGPMAWVGLDDFDNRPACSGPMSWQRCAGPAWLFRGPCSRHSPGQSMRGSCCG